MTNLVIVNARFLTQPITGVQRFAIEISKQLREDESLDVKFLTPQNILHRDLAKDLGAITIGHYKGHFWEQLSLPSYLKSIGNPLLLNFCNTGPIRYYNSIVTIHDLAFLVHPEWFSLKFRMVYRYLIPKLARISKGVITVSDFSKREIINRIDIPEKKIKVVYNCFPLSMGSMKAKISQTDFILFVGSLDRRKNIQNVIRSLEYLPEKLNLKIVGGNADSFNKQKYYIPKQIQRRIKFEGYVSDRDLNILYNNAKVFVYPSFYEGFGIPPLEAQAFGCPSVVSDIPVFREVFRDSVVYCDPSDPIDIATKINLVYRMKEDERNLLIERGKQNVNNFSWKESIGKLRKVIEENL